MNIEERIHALATLGAHLQGLTDDEFQSVAARAARENPWFTPANVRMAFNGIIRMLDKGKLRTWVAPYTFPGTPRQVALILAGNIPLVGFHDLLAVLISGHRALVKLSSKDAALPRYLLDTLAMISPALHAQVQIAEQLKGFQAVIATGSDNSARYFDYYFGKYPHIIRKNRTSVAILQGDETEAELNALGTDIFSYFGLGCRNVSKLLVPAGYTFDRFFPALDAHRDIIHHHKYCNNYDYQKSIMLVNSTPFLDNGYLMLHESTRLVSPISVVYYEHYLTPETLAASLAEQSDKLQCIVGRAPGATVPFGQAQFPEVWDYADRVDTLQFLATLS
ncbi:acyl-CoA reductase [Dawidia soli]|uniref:Acyl-CoA reductase n=1 Tax=Dawidia soli TaxID=2782352 RepID=A0AAP2GHN1_9BACT|nr:acyl-CoA reductase [Dawidia soli]MBT1686600.1 acyl-CoA reductase [Dawidia soli]